MPQSYHCWVIGYYQQQHYDPRVQFRLSLTRQTTIDKQVKSSYICNKKGRKFTGDFVVIAL